MLILLFPYRRLICPLHCFIYLLSSTVNKRLAKIPKLLLFQNIFFSSVMGHALDVSTYAYNIAYIACMALEDRDLREEVLPCNLPQL